MAFKKKEPGAEADPNIWRGGRAFHKAKFGEEKTYKDLGRTELLKLYRKIKPHSSKAIQIIAALMNKDDVPESIRLKAATTFLMEYRALAKEIFDSDQALDGFEDEEFDTNSATVVSLHVVPKNDD